MGEKNIDDNVQLTSGALQITTCDSINVNVKLINVVGNLILVKGTAHFSAQGEMKSLQKEHKGWIRVCQSKHVLAKNRNCKRNLDGAYILHRRHEKEVKYKKEIL